MIILAHIVVAFSVTMILLPLLGGIVAPGGGYWCKAAVGLVVWMALALAVMAIVFFAYCLKLVLEYHGVVVS